MDLALSFLLKETLRTLILPPGLLVVLLALGLWQWRRRSGRWLIGLSTALLYLLATPLLASALMRSVELPVTALPASTHYDAIVCLGGGKRFGAHDQASGQTINHETLARLRHGARLQRQSGKPLLVSGGAPDGGQAEAVLMQAALSEEFGIPVRWVEATSHDTRDNATHSAALLLPEYRRILLVSSAYHLPRAQRAFEAAGFHVTPAAADYHNQRPLSVLSLLPNASALRSSHVALRELVGSLWYRLRS